MKSSELMKSLTVAILVPIIFFLTLEFTQRVRWYFKGEKSVYWLLYGFVDRPPDFTRKIAKIAAIKEAKESKDKNVRNSKVYDIQIWQKIFPNGIKKHNPDFPEYKGVVNSLGFRSYEFKPEKYPGIYRIIAMGGSTTAGYESDIDHTYSALLQKELNDNFHDKLKFEVINAGIAEEELSYINPLLQSELVNYSPDMVIVYSAFNHLLKHRSGVNVPQDLHLFLYKTAQWFSTKSLLFLTLREKFALTFKTGFCLGDMYIPTNNPKTLAKAFLNTPRIFDLYRRNLEDFIKICKDHNIKPVLVTEACICKGDSYLLLGKDMEVIYDKMYGIMEDVAKKNSAIFIDAARAMRRLPDSEALLYTDGLHLRSRGNQVLADIIYAALRPTIEEAIMSAKGR